MPKNTNRICTHCWQRISNQVDLYNNQNNQFKNKNLPLSLQYQDLMVPDPYCLDCKWEVWFDLSATDTNYYNSKLIIINGPFASWKTTLASAMAQKQDFIHLDWEAIAHLVKTKQWLKKVHYNSIHADLLFMAEACLALEKNVIISHTILPDFWPLYEYFFREKKIDFEHIVLLPDLETIVEQNRLCKYKKTEDEEIENVFNQFKMSNALKDFIYDNTGESINQSIEMLFMALFPYEQKTQILWEELSINLMFSSGFLLNVST